MCQCTLDGPRGVCRYLVRGRQARVWYPSVASAGVRFSGILQGE